MKIAIVVGPDFEDSELQQPRDRLQSAGHQVELLGTAAQQTLVGKRGDVQVSTDAAVEDRDAGSYDALVIPGGYSPDQLRIDDKVVRFVRAFADTQRPIAAVCHGPQLLIEAELVAGKKMTSWPSVRKDLENAGATWVDEEVVIDGNVITSRKPQDLEAFSSAILAALERAAA